jgi:hypothetical protein
MVELDPAGVFAVLQKDGRAVSSSAASGCMVFYTDVCLQLISTAALAVCCSAEMCAFSWA